MRFLFQNHKYGQIIGKRNFTAGNFKRYADKIRNKNKG